MRRHPGFLLAILLAGVSLAACTHAPRPAPVAVDASNDEQTLRARVSELLARYAANDQAGVVAMLDPVRFTIWGSDLAEVADTEQELRALMDSDFRMWGTAQFTEVREFDSRSDGRLATANFVMSFSASGGPAIPVRLTTTWRKVDGVWRMTQCVSSVPTQRG